MKEKENKDKLNKKKLKDLDNDDDGSYSDYYKRMKEMADDKKLKEKDFRELLNNRTKGETDYKIVSTISNSEIKFIKILFYLSSGSQNK